MSLLPFATAWMAVSELAPQPVAFYAAVFFLVNATYVLLIWELVDRTAADKVSPRVRRIMHLRSIATLCLFGLAAVIALRYPLAGLGVCIACLIVYLRPDPPGAGKSGITVGSRRNLSSALALRLNSSHPSLTRTRAADRLLLEARVAAPECAGVPSLGPREIQAARLETSDAPNGASACGLDGCDRRSSASPAGSRKTGRPAFRSRSPCSPRSSQRAPWRRGPP